MKPVNPYALKTASANFTLDGEVHDYSSHIDTIRFIPNSTTTTWTGIDSTVIGDTSPETWQVELGLVQDLDPAGLLRFLMSNTGKKATLNVTLKEGAQPVRIEVTLASAGLGGEANGEIARSSLTLQASGVLEWLAAPGA